MDRAADSGSEPSTFKRRKPRGKLAQQKCDDCRRDKQKCEPRVREWPRQKCDRCEKKGFDCSANTRKQRASRTRNRSASAVEIGTSQSSRPHTSASGLVQTSSHPPTMAQPGGSEAFERQASPGTLINMPVVPMLSAASGS
ncbi:hypothetical protein B0T16DRAFT_71104 [Cercophora newfieldiana]|uniref:Zn(2)-C6 fungal-type domain-containing protein n=1 Tax=Cercophora newfieldiana TaxID=92897 RepID=A0AA40D037_9PEZI|nr:hypothetical protein B0T16DRAFT_71104 [Cercophora newfieldiana]